MGSIYKRGSIFWIKYYRNGIPMRESSESEKETLARSLLRQREGDIERGLPITPRTNRVSFEELAADVVSDYDVNGKRSLRDVTRYFEMHLNPYFEGWKAVHINTTQVRNYIKHRQAQGAKNASINRELSALKRGFKLAAEAGKLTIKPTIHMLQEDNVRVGFFEPERFEAVRARLPEVLRGLVTFAYITGWRVPSEVQPLQWRQVDFAAGQVRLDAGTTKNGEARQFPFTAALRSVLEAQWDYMRRIEREQGIICPWVFHRAGKPIKVFRKVWARACRDAGCPGMIRHDFRRTAVRNLVRAGIPERVAMTMTGHKTRSVFERYNIVSEGDLTDAAKRLDEAANKLAGTIPGTPAAIRSGHASRHE